MHTAMRFMGLGLFAVLGVLLIAFGVIYATVDSMLSFHAAGVPEDLRPAFLPLYLALMKLIGGASASLGALCVFLTVGLWKNRSMIVATALALAIAAPVLVAAYVAEMLAAQTGAPTSWHLMGVIIGILCIAYFAHAFGVGRARMVVSSEAPVA